MCFKGDIGISYEASVATNIVSATTCTDFEYTRGIKMPSGHRYRKPPHAARASADAFISHIHMHDFTYVMMYM